MNDYGKSIFGWTSSDLIADSRNFSNVGDNIDDGVVGSDAEDDNSSDCNFGDEDTLEGRRRR